MAYITGEDRNQITLFPEAVDDYITSDNPVRVIEAFVNSLDMQELGCYCHPIMSGDRRCNLAKS